MPVYNGEKHLREAIESILTQTFTGFELLVMDDGSTDQTPEILEEFAQKDHRVKIFRQENKGLVESLNSLAAHAKYDLIARMDADDISYPQRLEIQYEYMQKHPQTALLGTYAKIIENGNSNPASRNSTRARTRRNTALREDELNRWYLSIIPPFIHSAVMFTKNAFQKAGGYRQDEHPAEDYGLWVRMKRYGKLSTAPVLLHDYFLDTGGISARNFKKQIAKRDELNFKNLEDLYEQNEIPSARHALGLLKPYNLDHHQRQVLAKLACLTGCFYIQKNEYKKAAEYFRLCLSMDWRRFDAALNLILGKFKKAFLISIDKYPLRFKFLFKIHRFRGYDARKSTNDNPSS